MPKLICYALFDAEKENFERLAYVRGFYFNARMNNLIYPDWRTHVELDKVVYTRYQGLFDWLRANNNLSMHINDTSPELCEGMLWRFKPLFTIDVSRILCRDADSITTYREAQCVQEWIQSDLGAHAINDNPAHGGLMGGMVGFDSAKLKARMKWNAWDQVIKGGNFSQHGSDQNYMNRVVHPKISGDLFMHNLAGAGCQAARTSTSASSPLPQVNKALWESDLTCRHIGSAGVVELETLRFFKRFDVENWKYEPIEREYPKLFPWHQ